MRFAFSFLALSLLISSLGCGPAAKSPTGTASSFPAPNVLGDWNGVMVLDPAAAQTLGPAELQAVSGMTMKMKIEDGGVMELSGVTKGVPYTGRNRWERVANAGAKITLKAVSEEGKEKMIDMVFSDANTFQMPLKTETANLGYMKFERMR